MLAISRTIPKRPRRSSGSVRYGPVCFWYRDSRIPQSGLPRHGQARRRWPRTYCPSLPWQPPCSGRFRLPADSAISAFFIRSLPSPSCPPPGLTVRHGPGQRWRPNRPGITGDFPIPYRPSHQPAIPSSFDQRRLAGAGPTSARPYAARPRCVDAPRSGPTWASISPSQRCIRQALELAADGPPRWRSSGVLPPSSVSAADDSLRAAHGRPLRRRSARCVRVPGGIRDRQPCGRIRHTSSITRRRPAAGRLRSRPRGNGPAPLMSTAAGRSPSRVVGRKRGGGRRPGGRRQRGSPSTARRRRHDECSNGDARQHGGVLPGSFLRKRARGRLIRGRPVQGPRGRRYGRCT